MDIFEEAVNTFGEAHQIEKCIEECSELIVELQKYKQGRGSKEAVRGEVADVHICVLQMPVIFGRKESKCWFKKKKDRLKRRITKAKILGVNPWAMGK